MAGGTITISRAEFEIPAVISCVNQDQEGIKEGSSIRTAFFFIEKRVEPLFVLVTHPSSQFLVFVFRDFLATLFNDTTHIIGPP